jgi:hypothetical protein
MNIVLYGLGQVFLDPEIRAIFLLLRLYIFSCFDVVAWSYQDYYWDNLHRECVMQHY